MIDEYLWTCDGIDPGMRLVTHGIMDEHKFIYSPCRSGVFRVWVDVAAQCCGRIDGVDFGVQAELTQQPTGEQHAIGDAIADCGASMKLVDGPQRALYGRLGHLHRVCAQ